MDMDESDLADLEPAAWLFDIDRLEIPPPRANRPAARKFRREPETDLDESAFLDAITLPESVRQVLTHRHERWDGAGVPEGLAGAQIPRGARIRAVAGGYVSMTVGGLDRPPLAPHRALAELRNEAGRIFDPRAIEALASHLRETCDGQESNDASDRPDSEGADPDGDGAAGIRLPAVQRELYALYEIGRAVNYRLDLDENLTLILDKLESLVPHASAVVFLESSDRDGLRARFVRGIGASAVDGVEISTDACPSGTAFTKRRSTTGSGGRARMPYDPSEWDLDVLADSPLNAVLRTALASPLVFGGRCIGTLTLYDRAGRRFGDEERRRVAAVAGHVARAVHNADPGNPGYLESLTDPLTGLPNGRYLEICSEDLSPSAATGGSGFSLLAFRVRDLDRVCERSGIAAAERLLGTLARRLASNCTEAEVPVRYGQDLFVVLSPYVVQSELVRRWDILLRAAEGGPMELHQGHAHDLRLVSAHASCPEEGEDLDALLDVLGTRLGLAFDRGHTIVPFRLVQSAG
jgi:diguanylate cyclase (GGDEF)-like protein